RRTATYGRRGRGRPRIFARAGENGRSLHQKGGRARRQGCCYSRAAWDNRRHGHDRQPRGTAMRSLRFAAASVVMLALTASRAAAQTNLRIGLAEDPDVLDPTLARTYVGRIVFASLCDKLFDIDDKLNVVPQLALSYQIAPDGKAVVIKLRPGVRFH